MDIVSNIDAIISFIANFNIDSAISSDPQWIETTLMVSERLNIPPHRVVHHTDWSDIFHLSPNGNPSQWAFTLDSKQCLKNRDGWTIDVLSPTECRKLIELTELLGYEHCGYSMHYRSNGRVLTMDQKLADNLYHRIKPCLPSQYIVDNEVWTLCGLNERFRWCRYVEGQKFDRHSDARFARNEENKSFYTINIYLNDGTRDFKGGRTIFFGDSPKNQWLLIQDDAVTATPGMALMFNHYPDNIVHSGEGLTEGIKYLMRTDAMYQKGDSVNCERTGPRP